MSVSAATLGTSFYVPSGPPGPSIIDLGAGYGAPVNASDGTLFRREYIGYHTDDMSWFSSAPLLNALADPGITVNETTTNNELSDYFSVMWTGYFYAPAGGQYRPTLSSDDGSYLWMGDNAINNWTTATSIVNNGGPHGQGSVTGDDVIMVGGKWYPIRIVFGEIGGAAVFNFQIEVVGSGIITPTWSYSQGSPEGF
jgi:hypothetical protein